MIKNLLPPSLQNLIDQFERLPGIGRKTAQKLAFSVLGTSKEEAENFASSITEAHDKIKNCKICMNLTDDDICSVCQSDDRDRSTICVVEDTRYLIAVERTNEYNGLYHVLHGLISPMDGIGPDKLYIKELIERLEDGFVNEVIVATNANVEGEATALYIAKLLKPIGIKVTRLAYGIPVGGDLEYADEITIFRALSGRNEI